MNEFFHFSFAFFIYCLSARAILISFYPAELTAPNPLSDYTIHWFQAYIFFEPYTVSSILDILF